MYNNKSKNTDPVDPKTGKAKIGEVPGLDELKKRFKGRYTVNSIKGKLNKYSLMDNSGNTVSYTAGPKQEDNSVTVAEAINMSAKKKK